MTDEPNEPESTPSEMIDAEKAWKQTSIRKAPAESWIKGFFSAIFQYPFGS